jgi:hypothetical protein
MDCIKGDVSLDKTGASRQFEVGHALVFVYADDGERSI